MSFDLYVLVPKASWPTARQLDDALASTGTPVRLGERDEASWNGPLAPVFGAPLNFVIQNAEHARLTGLKIGDPVEVPNESVMPILLEDRLLDPDFGISELDDPSDINRQLEELGAERRALVGDYLLWFSHHIDPWNYNASMYVLVTLINQFDGYGFEFQGMSHGQKDFAAELLASLYANPDEDLLAQN